MKGYDLQGIALDAPREKIFDFVRDKRQLPQWTQAFARVNERSALMRGPKGQIEVGLEVMAVESSGTVDWRITFPDGKVAVAYSRVVEVGSGKSVYSFVLTPPPVPLEQVEGTLEEQSRILSEELHKLKQILEHDKGAERKHPGS